MAGQKQARLADTVLQIISDAVVGSGGECVPLHDGVLYATITDPSGRTDAIPVLLAIRTKSHAVALYEGYMRNKGYIPEHSKKFLRESYVLEGLDMPPELSDDRSATLAYRIFIPPILAGRLF